jgi:tetratricopeptide (TPR) repeat protein
MNLNAALQNAFASYQRGDYLMAETVCRRILKVAPDIGDAWQLLGVTCRKQYRLDEAEHAFRRALQINPGHVEALNSLGLVLLNVRGRLEEARDCFQKALFINADYAPARRNLAGLLLNQGHAEDVLSLLARAEGADFDRLRGQAHLQLGDPDQALDAFNAAQAKTENDGRVSVGRSLALTELGRFDDALQALSGNSDDDARIARAKAHLGAGRSNEAVDALAPVLKSAPRRAKALFLMAQCLWMTGHGTDIAAVFEDALRAEPDRTDLIRLYARTLKQMDKPDAALNVLDRLAKPEAADLAARADILIEAGRGEPAFAAAEAAVAAAAGDISAQAAFARAALMVGRADLALKSAQAMRARHPRNQFWIAIEAEALRAGGEARWSYLCDADAVAGAYDLPVPKDFTDIAAFNEALGERLRRLHGFKAHPLDQSLRNGVQTAVDLRRTGEPVIDAFFSAAQTVVDGHIAAMPDDADHPLFAFKARGGEIASAWSVLLKPGGRHVSHVHPEGWISSAYYVETPHDLEACDDHEGWLVLGKPPFTVPGASPIREIAARPGRLVLFPSYLWHGTRPIKSGERLTIAFDVRPKCGR